MTTNMVKQGTSLVSSSGEELSKLSQKAGTSPITPMGAKAIGANDHQQKMAGTPAHKDNVFKGETEKEKLDKVERVQPAKPPQQEQPNEKLERLKTLGSLHMQVENMVAQKMSQLQTQQAQLQIDDASVNVLPEEQKAPMQAALQQYAQSSSPEAKEAAVLQVAQIIGRVPTQDEMAGFFRDAQESLGETAKTVGGPITLADLELSSLGTSPEQLAADLGVTPEAVSAMSPAQLKQAIQDVEAREFNQAQALKAELATAVGQRREQIMQELQAMGAAGTIGQEAQFDRLQASIDNADIISFNGQQMSVEDLLKDDGLSEAIMDAVSDANYMKQLAKEEPELAQWIQTNMDSLAALTADARAAAGNVAGVQSQLSTMKGSVSDNLFKSIFGELPKFASSQDVAALQQAAAGSGLWQAIQGSGDLKARLERNPTLAQELKALSKEDINARLDMAKALEADGNLASLVGFTPGGIPTAEQVAKGAEWRGAFSQLAPSISADASFLDAVRAGNISPADAAKLVENPQIWDRVKEDARLKQQWSLASSSPEKMLGMMFGSDISVDDFNKGLSRLEAYAKMGDQDALSKLAYLRKNLVGADGKFGDEDLALLQQFAKQSADISPKDIIAGQNTFADLLGSAKKSLQGGATYESNDANKRLVAQLLEGDGKITDAEASALVTKYGEDHFAELMGSGWFAPLLQNGPKWMDEVQNVSSNRDVNNYISKNMKQDFMESVSGNEFLRGTTIDDKGNIKIDTDSRFVADDKQGVKAFISTLNKQIKEMKDKYYVTKGSGKAALGEMIKNWESQRNQFSAYVDAISLMGPRAGWRAVDLQNAERLKDPQIVAVFKNSIGPGTNPLYALQLAVDMADNPEKYKNMGSFKI